MAPKRLVAAIDAGPIASAVIETAEAMLPVLADRLDIITVGTDVEIPPAATGHQVLVRAGENAGEALVAETSAGDVAALVVGLRSVSGGPRPAGHVPTWILTHCEVPVIVVPPRLDRTADPLSRILLPLEGGVDSSFEVASLVDEVERRGSIVDSVHVFDRTSTPPFWERWDDPDLYADQFSEQFSPTHAPTELWAGDVASQILAAAEAHGSSLILLEWKRRLDETNAPIVRELLGNTTIPLMLFPLLGPEGASTDDRH